jgi:ParB family chromosome partitioning protein
VRTLAVAGRLRRRERTVLTVVPVRDIRPNPDQPRKYFDEERLAELATSIARYGLLQPIVLRQRPDGFELLAGERRLRAAQLAGVERLPALVRDVDDPLEVALLENLQREDLSPLEEAEAIATLIERHGYTHQVAAELLGKSRPYVSNTLCLTRLPDQVKAELRREGKAISRELLMSIAREDDPAAAVQLWQRLKLQLLSVRRFRETRGEGRGERPAIREVLLATRRLGRALGRLGAEEISSEDRQRLARALRRTERVVQRRLSLLEASTL